MAWLCEDAVNLQIHAEMQAAYGYADVAVYFGRSSVGLPRLQKYFEKCSSEEREHAALLTQYQLKRGGKVRHRTLQAPKWTSKFENDPDDEASYKAFAFTPLVTIVKWAFQHALQLEKQNLDQLLALHGAAMDANDPALTDFIESSLLHEQHESIHQVSAYLAQLDMLAGDPHGVFDWIGRLEI